MISYCSRVTKLAGSEVTLRLRTIQLLRRLEPSTALLSPAMNPSRINRIITTSATPIAVIADVVLRTIKLRTLYLIGITQRYSGEGA